MCVLCVCVLGFACVRACVRACARVAVPGKAEAAREEEGRERGRENWWMGRAGEGGAMHAKK